MEGELARGGGEGKEREAGGKETYTLRRLLGGEGEGEAAGEAGEETGDDGEEGFDDGSEGGLLLFRR